MAGNSFECCKPSSDGYNFCSGSSQKNPYSEDAYSDDPYRHLNASWYQQLWSQYWWWLNNQHSRHTVHQTRNHFPTWCSTCVEEREQRKRRVNLRKGGRCDNNFSLGKQTSSEPLFKNMPSRNQIQGEQGLQQIESTGVTEAHPSDTEESSSDEFEMELNNDFKKFLEQSAKHKEERSRFKFTSSNYSRNEKHNESIQYLVVSPPSCFTPHSKSFHPLLKVISPPTQSHFAPISKLLCPQRKILLSTFNK